MRKEEYKKYIEEQWQDSLCSIKKDSKFIAIFLISLCVFVYFCAANYNAIGHLNYTTVKWQSIDKAQNNYNIFKNAFDAQKQAVVDSYNKQIDEINKNGLETEANFAGLQFDNNVFADKINNNDQVLQYSHEAVKTVDKLRKTTVNTKIAKIKAFYDARVRNIYFALKNQQKVMFSSLKEYNRQPNNIQLTEADFTPVATKIVNTRVATTKVEPGKLPKLCNVLLLIFCFAMCFVLLALLLLQILDLVEDIGYYRSLGYDRSQCD